MFASNFKTFFYMKFFFKFFHRRAGRCIFFLCDNLALVQSTREDSGVKIELVS